jgi:hypothetical protein
MRQAETLEAVLKATLPKDSKDRLAKISPKDL